MTDGVDTVASRVTRSKTTSQQRSLGPVYQWARRAATATIPLGLVILVILRDQGTKVVLDSPLLVSVLNTIFITIVSVVFSWVAAAAYIRSGIFRLLVLGGAALTFGINSSISGFLLNTVGGVNHAITAYNIAALIAGLMHLFVAALFSSRSVLLEESPNRVRRTGLMYCALVGLSALVNWASLQDLFPPFFIEGSGPTPLRQIVLGLAVACWASAAIMLIARTRQNPSEFLYWYGLALGMTAVGLGAVFFQSATGSWLNWAGRVEQNLGGIYFGVALSLIIREAQVKGITLDVQIANFFRAAETNYRNLVETVQDAILAIDDKGIILLWNPAAAQMLGFEPGEALGANLFDLLFSSDPFHLRSEWERELQPSLNGQRGRRVELVAPRRANSAFPVEMTFSTQREGRQAIHTLVLRDISERRRTEQVIRNLNEDLAQQIERVQAANDELLSANEQLRISNDEVMKEIRERRQVEEALRLSEVRLRTALKHAPITVYNQDQNLNYVWAFNPWGLASTDLTGSRAEALVPNLGPEVEELKRHVITSGLGTRRQVQGTGIDGRLHHYDLTIDPLRDANDRVIGITCAAIDVTEYRQAAERIEELNHELERQKTDLEIANKELESFSYSVSHDLRTPLSSIGSLTQVLAEDHSQELSPQARRYFRLIQTGTQQMEELIESLLTLSRLTRHALKRQPVHMASLVLEALAVLNREPGQQGISLDSDSLGEVEADPVLIKQVWVNLIANAFKFTRHTPRPCIEIGRKACDGEPCAYYIKDNGVGFDMDQADRLFGVFQRLHGEHEFEGTGVGLAIVHRVIQRHGGRVWAEGKVGEGATFYFALPLSKKTDDVQMPSAGSK